MKKIIKDSLILFAITIIAGFLLGLVYKITKEPIKEQNEKTKLEAYQKVFSDYDKDRSEDVKELDALNDASKKAASGTEINEAVVAKDKDGALLGYIITVTDKNGYGGNIKMTVGIDSKGTITGLEILDISETAGLGMKATDKSWRNQFTGINSDKIVYTKNGKSADNEIDAISSATITTKAVTGGVNGALAAYRVLGGVDNE